MVNGSVTVRDMRSGNLSECVLKVGGEYGSFAYKFKQKDKQARTQESSQEPSPFCLSQACFPEHLVPNRKWSSSISLEPARFEATVCFFLRGLPKEGDLSLATVGSS